MLRSYVRYLRGSCFAASPGYKPQPVALRAFLFASKNSSVNTQFYPANIQAQLANLLWDVGAPCTCQCTDRWWVVVAWHGGYGQNRGQGKMQAHISRLYYVSVVVAFNIFILSIALCMYIPRNSCTMLPDRWYPFIFPAKLHSFWHFCTQELNWDDFWVLHHGCRQEGSLLLLKACRS